MVRSLRPVGVSGPQDPESPASSLFSALCLFVVRYWIGVRSFTGDSPESPAWPESSAPLDRNLRSAPMIESTGGWTESPALAGVSGPLTPESPAWTGSNG